MTRIRKLAAYILAVYVIVFVFNVNYTYVTKDVTHVQQTFSAFKQIADEYKDGDVICTYKFSETVFEYWLLINKLHFERVYLMEDTDIEGTILAAYDSMPENRKMFIIYSHFWGNKEPDTYLKILKERGYDVQVKESVGTELHIVKKH